jgi:hypothetical protein
MSSLFFCVQYHSNIECRYGKGECNWTKTLSENVKMGIVKATQYTNLKECNHIILNSY